jgi:hypothetical protein
MIFQSPPFHHLSINQLNNNFLVNNPGRDHGYDRSHCYIRYGTCHDGTCGFRILHVPRNLRLLIL